MSKVVSMNLKVKDYTNRVLGVVKEKYGLSDKSKALDKFAEMYGEEFVESEVREDYIKKLLKIEQDYFEKHGHSKKMSDHELDELFGK